MKKGILAAFIFVFISSVLFSCGKIEKTSTNSTKIGDHQILIVSTTDNPGSTSNLTHNNDSLSYLDENCSVQFKDEILTVNGKRYNVPNKSDSIYVKNNSVKINGVPVDPVD